MVYTSSSLLEIKQEPGSTTGSLLEQMYITRGGPWNVPLDDVPVVCLVEPFTHLQVLFLFVNLRRISLFKLI